jgi:hypothetical protein
MAASSAFALFLVFPENQHTAGCAFSKAPSGAASCGTSSDEKQDTWDTSTIAL